jgi:hypothetical protein
MEKEILNYEITEYIDAVDAITDKMCVDKVFYGSLVSSNNDIENILEEYDFRMNGKVKELFHQFIKNIRNYAYDELEALNITSNKMEDE